MSSQETDSSSMPMTFIKSPVEKHTSLPEISYIDPETESKEQGETGTKICSAWGKNIKKTYLLPLNLTKLYYVSR